MQEVQTHFLKVDLQSNANCQMLRQCYTVFWSYLAFHLNLSRKNCPLNWGIAITFNCSKVLYFVSKYCAIREFFLICLRICYCFDWNPIHQCCYSNLTFCLILSEKKQVTMEWIWVMNLCTNQLFQIARNFPILDCKKLLRL